MIKINAKDLNESVAVYIEEKGDTLPKKVLEFLQNSKFQQVYSEKAFDGADSPSDYWASVWYKDNLVTISFMYQCEPNCEDLDLTADELYSIYEIYCQFGMQDM